MSHKKNGKTGKHKKGRSKGKALFISLCISITTVALALVFIDGFTLSVVYHKIVWPIIRLMFFISIGLVAGQVIEASGWTRWFALFTIPLFSFARLGVRSGAAFTTAFVSGVASNAMLMGYYKDGNLSKAQLYFSNFINHFPAYFLHLPTTFFIVVPLTGKAGLYYFLITFSALVLRTTVLLIASHFVLPPLNDDATGEEANGKKPETKGLSAIVTGIKKRFPNRVMGVAVYVIPIFIAVFLVNYLGFFDWINQALAHLIVSRFIPVESLSMIVLGFTAEFTSGFAAAGALLNEGVLSVKQTATALVIGNIIAFPLRALRHQLPRYVGVFSPKMGTQLLLSGQLLRIFSLMICGVLFWVLYPG